jgi:diguanylate cyclase (GGDEF)-like protein/PAS domain S-box-containing protein
MKLTLLFFSSVLLVLPCHASIDDSQSLLLIYSYHPNFATTTKIYDGLMSQIAPLKLDIDIEFMDSKTLYTEKSVANFHQSLSHKIRNKQPYDYIVTSDDNALIYALEHQNDLFANTPIVFLGVNNIELAKQQNHNPFATGIVEAASFEKNVTLGKTLFPDADTIHVITDGTTSGKADMKKLALIQERHPELNWNIIDLSEQTWNDLALSLPALNPRKSFALLISAYRDKEDVPLNFEDSLQLIVENTTLPIIHPYEHGMGDGVLGGVMISHKQQAIEAGKMIVALTQGQSIADIPVLETSPNVPIFDIRELVKHSVNRSSLPPRSQVRFEQPTFAERYSYEIIFALLGVLALMGGYLRNRYTRSKQLKASERKLRIILDSIDSFIYLKDSAGHYLFANEFLRKEFDLSLSEVIGKTDFDLYEPEIAKRIVSIDREVIDNKSKYSNDEYYWYKGAEQIIHTTKVPLVDDNMDVYALCGISIDITKTKRHQKLLEQAAYYDPLTGLPNRLRFVERLMETMQKCQQSNLKVCMGFFDLDGFKVINDQFGHDVGDEVLKVIISKVHQHIDTDKMEMARLGGDEFYILSQYCTANPRQFDDILEIIKQPVEVRGQLISITASVGVTSYPQPNDIQPEQFFRQAEQALFLAKSLGKNRIEYYGIDSQSGQEEARKQQLSMALRNNEFVLFYQPKVSLTTGEVVGVEALIRWVEPEQGLLAPAAFLPDIESLGLIKQMDDWVIETALKQAESWYKSGLAIPVSVNVSNVYFRQTDIDLILSKKLAKFPQLPASLLEIEIVETGVLDNLTNVASIIESCKRLDIRFSLDDFGTGYSSLTYLQQLPVHTLKVDKSFVIDMLNNQKDLNILEGILGFCKAFQLTSVAEGVETLEHGTKLKAMGYDVAQGYGIARPMPVSEIVNWIAQWTPPSEWDLPTIDGSKSNLFR